MHKGTLTPAWAWLLWIPLLVGIWATPSAASECSETCAPCHGSSFDDVHGDFSHLATLGSGTVALFPDTGHDDAGHYPPSPYFGVTVDCALCHNHDLPPVHANECATCHPTPYDTLNPWAGGCQQGGCHVSFHDDVFTSHAPFANPFDPDNDCLRCHTSETNFTVTQDKCLNCHDGYAAGDTTPPTTTSNAQADYYGAAVIDFTITDNGKVEVGRTYSILDGGAPTIGSQVIVSSPGTHQLEFWSRDQYGNTESPTNTVIFTVTEDSVPPTTTSNAVAGGTYYNGATITLTATDPNPGSGVKTTYYQVDDGPVQTGTTVSIPATTGTFTYTLFFWSEDYAGNIEAENSVSFTVVSGTVTLKLVWGDSDQPNPQYPPGPGDWAEWWVGVNSYPSASTTPTGSGYGSQGWDGVDEIVVPVRPSSQKYYVRIHWYYADGGYDDFTEFPNLNATTPGTVHRLPY